MNELQRSGQQQRAKMDPQVLPCQMRLWPYIKSQKNPFLDTKKLHSPLRSNITKYHSQFKQKPAALTTLKIKLKINENVFAFGF
jgi:hypothetical protein